MKCYSHKMIHYVLPLVIYEALLIIGFVTNWNPSQNLCGEIFHNHAKCLILWIPFEMTGVHPLKNSLKKKCAVSPLVVHRCTSGSSSFSLEGWDMETQFYIGTKAMSFFHLHIPDVICNTVHANIISPQKEPISYKWFYVSSYRTL